MSITMQAHPTLFDPDGYPWVGTVVLARTAGRYPESTFYDDLARLATEGRLGAEELLDAARAGGATAGVSFDARRLAWFAAVTASRVESSTRIDDAADIFELALREGGRRIFARQLDFLWVEVLHLAGRLERHRSALAGSTAAPEVWWAADTDRLHPGTEQSRPGPDGDWLDAFNRPFTDAGLEAVTPVGEGTTMFDRLTATAPLLALDDDAPLVSVIMPVHNPDESLRTAVRSLLAQTWSRLEILLCDDGSTAGGELFTKLSGLDPRVRVVRAAVNQGAYAARNLGIGHARGEFITFNDADDWSHPRRIERQLAPLLAPSAFDAPSATVSHSVRATEELRLTVLGRPPRRINLSSLLLRRSDMLEHLGGFDHVRRGGDSELISRLRAVLGAESLLELEEPLAMVQLTGGSLSRDDYRFMRTHPARLQYTADFRHWHATLRLGDPAGCIAPGTRAPVPAPAHISGAANGTQRVDVLVLANLGAGAPTCVDLAGEVEQLCARGLSVGLVECVGPFDATTRIQLASGRLAELLRDGSVHRLLPGQHVEAGLVVARDPAAVATMPPGPGITACRAVIVADYAPAGNRYDPAGVAALMQQTADEVCWLPATPMIAAALAAALPAGRVLEARPVGRIPVQSTPSVPFGRWRVGVCLGSAHTVPRGEADALLRGVLPRSSACDVVVWDVPGGLAARASRDVMSMRPGDAAREEFARQVDVLVVVSAHGRGSHLDTAVVAALAAGRIVILDPAYREHFGDAALYLDGATVDEWLETLAADPARFEVQQRQATGFVAQHLAAPAFDATLDHVLDITTWEDMTV